MRSFKSDKIGPLARSLTHSLAPMTRLLHTARFARALRCALVRSLTHLFAPDLIFKMFKSSCAIFMEPVKAIIVCT